MFPDDKSLDRALNLAKLKLPPQLKVDELRWERIIDSLGDEALQVRLVLDDTTQYEDLRGLRGPIRQAVKDALVRAGIHLFPYLRISTRAELAESLLEE